MQTISPKDMSALHGVPMYRKGIVINDIYDIAVRVKKVKGEYVVYYFDKDQVYRCTSFKYIRENNIRLKNLYVLENKELQLCQIIYDAFIFNPIELGRNINLLKSPKTFIFRKRNSKAINRLNSFFKELKNRYSLEIRSILTL